MHWSENGAHNINSKRKWVSTKSIYQLFLYWPFQFKGVSTYKDIGLMFFRLRIDDTQAYIRMNCERGNPVSALGVGGNGLWTKIIVAHTLMWPSGLVCLATCIKRKRKKKEKQKYKCCHYITMLHSDSRFNSTERTFPQKGDQFHKACQHKNLLSTENSCVAKIGYQPKYCTFIIVVTGTLLISCLAKEFT